MIQTKKQIQPDELLKELKMDNVNIIGFYHRK